jgi:hypothetical protein
MRNFIENYQLITNEQFYHKTSNVKFENVDIHLDTDSQEYRNMLNEFENHLTIIQDLCREKWSKFNETYCIFGILMILLSLINTLVFISKLCFDEHLTNDSMVVDLYSNFCFVGLRSSLCFVFILWFKQSVGIWSIIFNLMLLIKFRNDFKYLISFLLRFIRIDYGIYFFILLLPFTNSYIIRENSSLRFLAVSFLFYTFFKLKKSGVLLRNFVLMIMLVRFSSLFYVCREEVLESCVQTRFTIPIGKLSLTNEDSIGYLLFVFLNFFVMILVYLYCFKIEQWRERRQLNLIFLCQILILFVYWMLKFAINIDNDSRLKYVSVYVARVYYLLFLTSQFTIWYRKRVNFDDNFYKMDKIKANEKRLLISRQFYSLFSSDCLISCGLLISILANESFLSIWILILIIHLFSNYAIHLEKSILQLKFKIFFELKFDVSISKGEINANLFFLILQFYFFYATGHETTFTHIKWETAFHGFHGDGGNIVSRGLMAILVMIETFSSNILISIGWGLLFAKQFKIGEVKQINKKFLLLIIELIFLNGLKVYFFVYSPF